MDPSEQVNVVKKQEVSPVQQALDSQSSLLRVLHERIGTLEDRLLSVLTETPAKAENGEPEENRSNISYKLERNNAAIDIAAGRIMGLLDRLEV